LSGLKGKWDQKLRAYLELTPSDTTILAEI